MNENKTPTGNISQPYVVEFCFQDLPVLDAPLLEKILRMLSREMEGTLGAIQHRVLSGKKDRYSAGLLILPERLEAMEQGPAGFFLSFDLRRTEADNASVLLSLEQTWQWSNAEEAVLSAPCRATLVEVNTLHLEKKIRLDLLQKSLYALTSVLLPAALHFPQSQCLLEPAAYLENKPGTPAYFRLYGLVNTRLFTPRIPGARELFMDTLGMHLLGLPDLQCLIPAGSLDYAELTCWFCNLADYLCGNPGGIRDGDFVTGLNSGSWEVHTRPALLPPGREMLEILIPSV